MALLAEKLVGGRGETSNGAMANPVRLREWMHRIVGLLDVAVGQLHDEAHPAMRLLLEAATILRQQIDPQITGPSGEERGRLLAWQALKIQRYIDSHIAGPVRIEELCALIQRSAGHFSRSFKRTFGKSPHAFVIRRRLELAAQFMLDTDATLSDISLRCGFADQAHLCKHFRQTMGQTPASWRRARRAQSPLPGKVTATRLLRTNYRAGEDSLNAGLRWLSSSR
jgi:AraC family transcriptional regulator